MTAEAKLDITGSSETANREIEKLTRSMAKLREQNRQLNQESAKGSRESAKSLDSWSAGLSRLQQQNDKWAAGVQKLNAASGPFRRDIDTFKLSFAGLAKTQDAAGFSTEALTGKFAKVVGGLAIASQAIRVVKDAWAGYRQELDAAAQKHEDFQGKLTKDIAFSRDVSAGKEIERALSNIPGVKKEDALAAFSAVTQEAPTMRRERRLAISQNLSRLAASGGEMKPLGTTAAQLGEILPGEKPEDVGDIAALLHREAGGDMEKLGGRKFQKSIRQLIESGAMTPDEALATGIAAARGKISSDTLSKMAETAAASKQALRPSPGEHGQIPAAKRRLATATPRERIAMMRRDKFAAEAGLGEGGSLELQRLSPDEVTEAQGLIEGARREDLVGGITRGAMGTQAGRQTIARYAAESVREKNMAAVAARTEEAKIFQEVVRGSSAGQGFMAYAGGEIIARGAGAMNAMGMLPSGQSPNIDRELQKQTGYLAEIKAVLTTKQHVSINAHTESHGASGSW